MIRTEGEHMKGSKLFNRGFSLKLLMFLTMCCLMLLVSPIIIVATKSTLVTSFTSNYNDQNEVYQAANAFNEALVEEGIVLLKNENQALPLAAGSKVNVLGKNSHDIDLGNTTIGSINYDEAFISPMTLYESLEAVGYILNPDLISFYENDNLSGTGRHVSNLGIWPVPISIGETPQENYSQSLLSTYADYSDASIVVFTRIGGIGFDLPTTMTDALGDPDVGSEEGDHYLELNLNEEALLLSLESDPSVSKVIVIINASQPMELGFLNDSETYSKIKAALWVGGPGVSGVSAIGRVLVGDINPSGHLVDTYITDFKTDPTWFNLVNRENKNRYGMMIDDMFTETNVSFVDYEEGIYGGYRYWETAGFDANDNWSWYDNHVVYPFGYGLSYSTFNWELVGSPIFPETLTVDSSISITIRVTNTSSVPGKDVVQLYYTPPYYDGGIEKSYIRLADFEKTPLLNPSESADITLTVSLKDLASYDYQDANNDGFIGYELEAGSYIFNVLQNANIRSTNGVSDMTLVVPVAPGNGATSGQTGLHFAYDEVTGHEIENLFNDVSQKALNGQLDNLNTQAVKDSGGVMHVMSRATAKGGLSGTIPIEYPSDADRTITQTFIDNGNIPVDTTSRNVADITQPWYQTTYPIQAESETGTVSVLLKDLIGLDYNDPLWETFMNQMTYQEMATLIGDGTFHTIPISRLGKPWSIELSGTTGLIPRQETTTLESMNEAIACVYATQPVVAATWNKSLVYDFGEMVGEESIWGNTEFAYSGIYAPGLNIHRSPFSGRNFEYYSEDAVLSAKIAKAFSSGAYSKGLSTIMNHLVLNEQETNREGLTSWVDEQTLREIYLYPFEKVIKNGQTHGAMVSYSKIGNTWTSTSYALLTELLKDEWGYEGMIMTDWVTYSSKMEWMIRAGVDLLLTGNEPAVLNYEGEDLTATQAWALRNASKDVLFYVANSNAMIPRLYYEGESSEVEDFTRGVAYTLDVSGVQTNYELDTPLSVTYTAEGLPNELLMDPSTGILTGTLPVANPSQWWNTPPTSYTFTVTVTVPEGTTINTSISKEFTIHQASMQEIYLLDTATVGETYYSDAIRVSSSIPVDATDIMFEIDPGLALYNLVVREPSQPLPDGLVMNPDGTITGIPTTPSEPVDITVQVTAPGFVTTYITRTISVRPADPKIVMNNVILPKAEVNQTYQAIFVATGSDEITFTSDEIPIGLALNPNGTLSGTPEEVGTHMFHVTASAIDMVPVSAVVVLVVYDTIEISSLTFQDKLLESGQVGISYNALLSASGADDIVFTSHDLPPGITLNDNGTLTGIPTEAGVYLFHVTATASGMPSSEAIMCLSITETEIILPVITLNHIELDAGEVGSAYSATITASGATNIIFSTEDQLPTGLTLSTDGILSGTPTDAGTYIFKVTASADGTTEATAFIAIQINPIVASSTGCGSTINMSAAIVSFMLIMIACAYLVSRKTY